MLNKEKYKDELEKILVDVLAVSKSGEVGRCMGTINCGNCIFIGVGASYAVNARSWLNSECKEPILTEEEKAYLSAVIKPFRYRINAIRKYNTEKKREYIAIFIDDGCTLIDLPDFESGTMYCGIELGEKYTLEELGL